MRNKKAFTIIELVAVLVILAILALIVTPIVMSIINKAKDAANKRSIDAYGRSIELAIASHLLDTGEFPTSISDLTIEYNGDEVVCGTTQINSDSTVYLAGCTVGGKNVAGYTYGSDNTPTYEVYSVGDEVSYNNVDYYVIEDSEAKEDTVTLLKAEPLTMNEIQSYSAGTGAQTQSHNSYGGMQYHSSSNNYATSFIKIVVDAWKDENAHEATTARLLTLDDLPKLGYELQPKNDTDSSLVYKKTDNTPSWVYVYNSNNYYWTESQYQDSTNEVWFVNEYGGIGNAAVDVGINYGMVGLVRPVIIIKKSAL